MEGIPVTVALWSILTWLIGVYVTAGVFVYHLTVIPLLFKYSKTLRRSIIFANFVQWPIHINFEDPSASGIDGARNLSLEYDSKVDNCRIKLGFWHILPMSTYERLKGHFENNADKETLNRILDEELANSKKPIIMYCHGNSNSRAASHRIKLYKFFQQMDFHTIAFDYRGFADSTYINPSENGVVEDSLVVYEWINTTVERGGERPPVFVWGHSLGTGITSHLLGNLNELCRSLLERQEPLPPPNGLILEAPFNNIADEVDGFPLCKFVKWLPYYDVMFIEPFRVAKEFTFKSDQHLTRAQSLPILVLHAKDDIIVPFALGVKLYKAVVRSRAGGGATIKMHSFECEEHLGHKLICNARNLDQIVGDFVRSN